MPAAKYSFHSNSYNVSLMAFTIDDPNTAKAVRAEPSKKKKVLTTVETTTSFK